MARPREIGPEEVLIEACRLAEAMGTTVPHQLIAENLKCSRQHVTTMFRILEDRGVIIWITQKTYAIKESEWIPPPDIS